MSIDKRTVSTDALETLGMIHTREEKRDAIHLAVIPAEAGQNLNRAEHVYLYEGKAFRSDAEGKSIGIVDPFLDDEGAKKGQRFWLVIFPRVITSLRHVWSHPEIADEAGATVSTQSADPKSSEEWLRGWCASSEISYEDLIEVSLTGEVKDDDKIASEYYGGRRWQVSGDSLLSLGSDAYGEIPMDVWLHVRNVIGKEPMCRASYFSCSC